MAGLLLCSPSRSSPPPPPPSCRAELQPATESARQFEPKFELLSSHLKFVLEDLLVLAAVTRSDLRLGM